MPLLGGIVLSIAIHVAALYGKGVYTPPSPKLEAGQTVVHLTLMPSIASPAAAPEPEPVEPEPQPEEPAEPVPEPTVVVPVPVEPAPIPVPEPVTVDPPSIPKPKPQAVVQEAAEESVEQDASLIENKGVISEAQSTASINPVYPRISRRRGEEGIVTLSVQVLANGKAGNIQIIQSSGHKRLDEAAFKAVQKASFNPATQFGRNIDSETKLSFTFRLTND